MEYKSTVIYSVVGVIFIGALLQTFHVFPQFFDTYFDSAAFRSTVALILIAVSFFFVNLFLNGLQRWNREGFENPSPMTKWKETVDLYQIQQICELKSNIEEKMIANEKLVNKLNDEQAKETVTKELVKGTTSGLLDCTLFKTVNDAKDIDSFFTALQTVPDGFYVQAHETISTLHKLLVQQTKLIEESLAKVEGFVSPSVGICSGEVTEQRRKFLREKKLDEEAQRCLLPEEVPLESKETLALKKLEKMQTVFDDYSIKSPTKELISELVEKSKQLQAKIEERGKQAESGELLQNLAA